MAVLTKATDKQIAFIISLIGDRNLSDQERHDFKTRVESEPSKSEASSIIETLLSRDKTPRFEAPEPGFYQCGDRVCRVSKSKSSPHSYLKVLNPENGRWLYVPGGIAKYGAVLTKLDLSSAVEFGHKYGICAMCGRALTNPESVAAGIGPICANKL